jgi:ribA/ribD-fused uncharacterized protein
MKYSIRTMMGHFESGENVKFLYFWGHTAPGKNVGKQCLSQWYESPFQFEGVTYQTSEHWMMAQKALLFNDPETYEKIIDSKSTKKAKSLGRTVKNFGPDVWNENKIKIVVDGNIHKFTQNIELFRFLKATNNKYLIEASPNDKVWGIGISEKDEDIDNPYLWKGENLLGFALMEVRDRINKLDYFRPIENELPPPWVTYPEIECGDMFWRMGAGEDYITKYFEWWGSLSDTEKEIYRISYPYKNGWGF